MSRITKSGKKKRTLKEKENYKYFGILEIDTINQVDMKLKKNISGERENYSKPNYKKTL